MPNLMIVDDDALMCNQVAALIDWEDLGIQIVCYASDGQEAIEALESREIDFVLTDMSMPQVSGVELIEYISSHFPDIHVIALSAYDDFHFVRNSLRFGAYDYMLKSNLTKEGLEKLFRELIGKDRMEHDVRNHANLTYEQLKASFFMRLIRKHDFDRDQINNILKNLDIRVNRSSLAVILVGKTKEMDDEVLNRSVFHMCQQILQEADFSQALNWEEDGSCFVVSFLKDVSQATVMRKLESWGSSMVTGGKRFFNLDIPVSISEICGDIASLRISYEQALNNAEVFFYDPDKKLICAWKDSERGSDRKCGMPVFPARELKGMIRDGKKDEAEQMIRIFFGEMKKQRPPIIDLVRYGVEAFNKLILFAEEEEIPKDYLFQNCSYRYEDFRRLKSIKEWEDIFLDVLDRLFGAVTPVLEHSACHEYTRFALKKIHVDYGKPLSLAETAEELGVSGAYLSRIFKADIGMGFSEYLNKVRIDHVIGEIRDGNGKLKEIVQNAGFQNYNYFFRVFKEQTGMTPTQYFG